MLRCGPFDGNATDQLVFRVAPTVQASTLNFKALALQVNVSLKPFFPLDRRLQLPLHQYMIWNRLLHLARHLPHLPELR